MAVLLKMIVLLEYIDLLFIQGVQKSGQAIAGSAPTTLICPDVRYAQNEPLALQGHKVYFNCYACMHVMLKPMEMHKGALLIVYQTAILADTGSSHC